MKKKKTPWQYAKPYLFLLPIYALMVIFKYIPFGMAVEKSFFTWNGTNVNQFAGLANYAQAFRDPVFMDSLKNVGIIAVAYVLIVLTIPILAAELLYAVRSRRK